ncbi:NADP-dependent oxidoreductase [Rhodococcus rhodnii]|uniref:NADPH:quinone reductase n=2 Tax=Rhodococcus rhodnii TaxID=38312 RepID=R7WTQ1_9NOCA|nr:NADP-dependent oxidoreductase [Rhodococcus rhodnii]EOM77524.1 NADPH:quinone reductase [Rhodococcus rhodnii LMG 5362]TXG90723.1 NADP-dependent oxidoreductase [Rhodococcus rhodnii]
MKAFVIDRYGGDLHEADVPEPTVGARDVLVDIRAASVNPLDVKVMEGRFKQILPYRPPFALGHDLAGVVTAVGPEATGFAVGDAVFSRVRDHRVGTFAERIAVDHRDLAHTPSSVTFAEAASLALVGLTSWQALVEIARVQPGNRVLIHAGAGGFGTCAVQLAAHLGAQVATTATAGDADLLHSLVPGITVVDHRTEDFAELLHDYDVVLDTVGGENLERSLRVLAPGGTVVGLVGPPTPEFAKDQGMNPFLRLAISAMSAKVRRQARKRDVDYRFLFMRADGAQLSEVSRLIESGAIRPVVGASFAFERTPDALAALTAGGVQGKVVVTRG